MTDMQTLFQLLDTLTPEERDQVQEYLLQNPPEPQVNTEKRILGLHAHLEGFWMSDDFNNSFENKDGSTS